MRNNPDSFNMTLLSESITAQQNASLAQQSLPPRSQTPNLLHVPGMVGPLHNVNTSQEFDGATIGTPVIGAGGHNAPEFNQLITYQMTTSEEHDENEAGFIRSEPAADSMMHIRHRENEMPMHMAHPSFQGQNLMNPMMLNQNQGFPNQGYSNQGPTNQALMNPGMMNQAILNQSLDSSGAQFPGIGGPTQSSHDVISTSLNRQVSESTVQNKLSSDKEKTLASKMNTNQ